MSGITQFNTLHNVNCFRHPCKKNCSGRYPGCGTKCEKWLAYVKTRNQIYKQRELNCDNNCPTVSGLGRYNRKPKKR